VLIFCPLARELARKNRPGAYSDKAVRSGFIYAPDAFSVVGKERRNDLGAILGREAFDGFTVCIEEELGEVPFDAGAAQQPRKCGGGVAEERISCIAIHVDFFRQGKADTEVQLAEGFNFLV